MYEVTWMIYEIDWDRGGQEQFFESVQFNTYEEALDCFEDKKKNATNEYVRIVKILNEFTR